MHACAPRRHLPHHLNHTVALSSMSSTICISQHTPFAHLLLLFCSPSYLSSSASPHRPQDTSLSHALHPVLTAQMIIWNNLRFACEQCQKGHRNAGCKHIDRPLYEIRTMGRPQTQCGHCRVRRKTKESVSHVKCVCAGKGMGTVKEVEGTFALHRFCGLCVRSQVGGVMTDPKITQ